MVVKIEEPTKGVPISLEDKILFQAAAGVQDLLKVDWPEIYQAYQKAHIESGDEKFAFNVGLGIKLQPGKNDVKVTCKIACNVKFEDETAIVIVSNQPDMFRA